MALDSEDASGLKNVFRGDITDPSSLDFPECDCVIHCAGILESSHPTKEMLMKVNFKGTENVFEEASNSGAEGFVFISSISALGPRGSREVPMTEEMEPRPVDAYGKSKLEAERSIMKKAISRKITVTILRPSVLYGPGMNLNSSGMKTFTSLNKGIMPLVGNGDTTLNMLYVDNLVDAVMAAIGRRGGPAIYHVSEYPYTQKKVIETIEKSMGRKGHRKYPKSILWIMTLMSEYMNYFFKGPPPLSWTKYKALTSDIWTMSSEKIERDLNFHPSVTLEEGVAMTCDHYGWSKKK
jgi:nucleoside-diphosphate-sugar epimerase